MNEELALFLEDVEEQLTFMENALISIQEDGIDAEGIGALFRAMHTIKGTAGMFEFTNVVSFAHTAENLLSEVRDEKVELTEEMIETLFKVKDHVQTLVDLAVEGEELEGSIETTNKQLLDSLISMLSSSSQKQESQTSKTSVETEQNGYEKLWHISFRLKPNFFSSGMDVINILNFFTMLGDVEKQLFIGDKVPTIDELNPTQSYIGYEMLFKTESPYEEIEEIFEFVIDDVELKIFDANDTSILEEIFKNDDTLEKKLLDAKFCNILALKDKTTQKPQTTATIQTKKIEKKQNKKEQKKSFSLRVDSTKIDQLINQISEMVIANAKVRQRADILDDTELSESAIVLSDMLEEVRTGIMNIRMVQVGDSFNKFKRIVHDVAKKVGKEIDFEIVGGDTELDKMVVEKISDPLMHMLRNSIDHGIEMPQEREALGKNKKGRVVLKTYPDAGTIVIEISDDGKGLDKEKIVQKAITNGLITENHNLSDKEIYKLIFAAGLSTAEKVSDISGRGVGMDVVKRNIEALRGSVDIDSKLGEGSLFTIRLPLTLAIIDGFLVQSGKTKYIIPLEMIQECIELDEHYKKEMKENKFINLRDSMLPLLDVREFYKEAPRESERENIVVVRYGEYKIGMMVDELFGEFQTVIKPLGVVFKNVPGISGGTILGSGEIALIFDIPKLMEYKIKTEKKDEK